MSSVPTISNLLRTDRANRSPHQRNDNLTVVFFLLPGTILFLIFVVFPIAQSMYYSLFSWKGFGPAVDLVGMDNYLNILKDRVFITALRNGLLIVVFSLLFQLPFALGLAMLVGRDLPGRAFFRSIFFMPFVLSEVISAIMWMSLFNPDPSRGFLNFLITLFPGVEPVAWLGNIDVVLASIFVALTWKYFGLHMLLYMAGLQNIPVEIEEAARIDGASAFENFIYIVIPLLGSTIRTSAYLSVIGSLQQFIFVWIMTKGGPVNASEVMSTYMYRFGFVRFQLGYGSAVAIYMFLISLTFSLIYLRLSSKPDYLTGV